MRGIDQHVFILSNQLTWWKSYKMLEVVLLHPQITVTCLRPEYATSAVTRDSLSCSLVLRPQASPRGALLPTSGDKYIVPCSIISAWIQNKYKMVCTPEIKATFKDSQNLENVAPLQCKQYVLWTSWNVYLSYIMSKKLKLY